MRTPSYLLAVFSLVLLQQTSPTTAQADIKGSLSTCLSTSGTDLDGCLGDLAEKLRPFMKTGLPDFKVPVTEPMFLEEIIIKLNKAPIDVTVTMKDTTVQGLSSFILNSVRASKEAKTITTNITVPSLLVDGQYSMAGFAFIVIDDSNGPFNVKMTDVTVVMTIQLTNKDGRLFIEQSPDIKVKLGKLEVSFENLFGGKAPQFALSIQQFLNNESDKFIQDFGPQITQQVGNLAKSVYNAGVSDLDPAVFGLE